MPDKDDKTDADDRKKKNGAREYDLRKIGIDYIGREPMLFVEQNGLVGKIVEQVKLRWAANEKELVDKTFGGRRPRYE